MAIGGTTPPTPVTALPFEAVSRLKPVAKEAAEEPAQPKSKVGFYVGLLVAAGLVFAAIAVVLEARMERAKAYDLEQQEQLAHHIAEQRLKEAEQVAKEEAERSRKELEAAIEATKKKTEEETRRRVMEEQEAQRLAKLPGSLVVATAPAGAAVSIDGAAPLTSPVKAEGIAPGSHQVQVSLAGFEPVQTTVEVKGGTVADLGMIKLQTIYGALELASSPDGLEFAIRAAADPAGKPVRTGRTPATINEIAHGDYVVTFSRPGCRDHTSKATVVTGAKARAETNYVDGSLELTSDPSGASVSKDGSFLGTTPLVIHDLTPKVATFALTLPGYDSTPVSCEIPEGQTLKFSAHLLRRDRVFTASEVKTPPESYSAPAPVLSASQRKTGGEVVLSLIVRRDGSVVDVGIVRSTDDDIARRCKLAVEKWLFRAATAPDDRTVDARIELPFKFPASPQ
jgi:TonB family protein